MLLDLEWWRNSHSVGLRSDYEGQQTKEASKEFKILFIGIVYKATWKAMIHHIALSPNISSLENETKSEKSINFHLQWEEESEFLHAVAIQAGQNRSNLRRKQIYVIINACQDMLKNVDEIISWPFPVNRVFIRRLTNFKVSFILQPFVLDHSWIVRLKVCLKVVLNSTAFCNIIGLYHVGMDFDQLAYVCCLVLGKKYLFSMDSKIFSSRNQLMIKFKLLGQRLNRTKALQLVVFQSLKNCLLILSAWVPSIQLLGWLLQFTVPVTVLNQFERL